ncbi:hypothetical protein ETB97_008249 [Aspergillus alliaceus]|uniref:T6SS Phospholipase effector Tle1-like catalytic domain-containing protein n=1 Tax=Petromyces alliaceus TaxID=209559 RepID=A0A8H6ABQ1_PETAA|nr:hypothetical protein ETB97_008249 [Aspergillus burnettii]
MSDDQSLFAWDASEFEGLNATGLLALTPVFFKNSKNIVPFRFLKNSSPFTVTNKGIRLQLPLATLKRGGGRSFGMETITEKKALILECQEISAGQCANPVVVLLGQLSGSESQFIRIRRNLQKHTAWGHLRFTEPSTIYARKICWGFEEAVIKPARATLIQGTEPVAAKSQHNLILLFDSGCRNRHRTGTGSTIQAMRHLISDTGDSQICCFDQTAADEVDSIEMRVMRAYKWCVDNYSSGSKYYIFGFSTGGFVAQVLAQILEYIGVKLDTLLPTNEHEIWNTYLAWYLATSRGNRDMARSEFSRMTSLRSWNQGCTVTFLGLFDSVNMAPGCNLARGTSGRLKEEDLPSVLIHPALVVRHAVAIDEQHPALRPNLANEIAGCTHDFQELWFPGGHADIGGVAGSDTNEKWRISSIPLVWMIREAARAGMGFNPHKLRQYFGLDGSVQVQVPVGDKGLTERILSGDEVKDGLYCASKMDPTHEYWRFCDRLTPRSILRAGVLEDISPFDIRMKALSAKAEVIKEKLTNTLCHHTMGRSHGIGTLADDSKQTPFLGQGWLEQFLYSRKRFSSSNCHTPDNIRRIIPNGAAYHTSVLHRMCSELVKYRPSNIIDVFVIIDHPFRHGGWQIKRQGDFIGEYRILGSAQYGC